VTSALNPEQLAAVSHGEGPALVLAGPGSGKTTALVERYCRLVGEGVDPSSILTATFSAKAALTLRQRIRSRLDIDTRTVPVGTFHSFALQMLRENVPGMQAWRVLEDRPRFSILRALAHKHRVADAEELADAIDRFKDRLIDPALARESADSPVELAIAGAYEAYQNHLEQERLLDFAEMIRRAQAALRADAALRKLVARRFRFVMIDEYQDINPAQDALIELLLVGHSNLWVVGDDDQAIYGWRGSDVRYITDFERRFPGARFHRLERNYRSREQILQVADALIRHNSRRLGKVLRPEVAGKTRVVVCRADNERFEAEWIASSVQKLIHVGTPLREIAVLVRTRHLTFPVEASFRALGIPYQVRPAQDFWEMPEVRAVLEVARYLEAGRGELALTLDYLVDDVSKALRESRSQSFPARLRSAAEAIAKRPVGSAERRIEWSGCARQVADEAGRFGAPAGFLAYVEQQKSQRKVESDEAVIISTIHQAKGLEWEAVFLAAAESGVLPHAKTNDEEEERRLAFVALTRAKRYLCVSHSYRRGDKRADPSAFVREMTARIGWEIIDERRWPEQKPAREKRNEESKKRSEPKKTSDRTHRRATDPSSSRSLGGVGQSADRPRVEHAIFGVGVVLSRDAKKLVVRFADGQVRTILETHLTPVPG
jgi:DNA helicase-2/ATP-dependent DNA helicase PcrA